MNNDNTHICWSLLFLSPTSFHHATKSKDKKQINKAKILVERVDLNLTNPNLTYLSWSIGQGQGHNTGQRAYLFVLAFYCVQQKIGGRFWECRSDREGKGAGGGACCRGAIKYAYGFCIRWMSVLCMISSLRVATSCHGNNHSQRPWLTTLYVASVSSTQASHSC